MDTNKNSYTIIYATVLVVFVAAVLAFVSSSLKDKQQKNVDVETQLSLLSAVGLGQEASSAPDKTKYVQEEYKKYITKSLVVNYKGDEVEGDAFKINLKEQFDIMKRVAVAPADKVDELKNELTLPVFFCTLPTGENLYILSCYGAGLWGPIWGYVALKGDFNTIYGAVFAHKGETPGLGAEIATANFCSQFIGKEIFTNNDLTSIIVAKGGAAPGSMHEVDAISGGTITSKALESTIKTWLDFYHPYINKMRELAATPMPLTMASDSTVVASDSTAVVNSVENTK